MPCDGAPDDLFRQGSVGGSSTVQLAADYTIQVEGTRATPPCESPQFKSQQESSSPQDDWEWEMALNTPHSSYGNIRGHQPPDAEVRPKSAATPWPSPPPEFANIAWSLHGDTPPQTVTGIPSGLDREQSLIWVAGTTLFFTSLTPDEAGTVCVDLVTCQMRIMAMGPSPEVDLCSMPTLEDPLGSD